MSFYVKKFPVKNGAFPTVRSYPTGMNGLWDDITGFAKDVGKGAVSLYGKSQEQKGAIDAMKAQQKAQQAAGMPAWILPVAIGAGALTLVLLLKKRK